jgi:heme-degrading monooxygenase HmoA
VILRRGGARTTPARLAEYLQHFIRAVEPELRGIEGFRDAMVLQRAVETDDADAGSVEILVVSRWESMEAVRRFAGADPNVAVVDPAAAAVLTSYDRSVEHFTIMHRVD